MTALRLGCGAGLLLLVCVGSWWLGLASPALAAGGHPTAVADAALRAYTSVAALWLVLAAPRLGIAHGTRAAFAALVVALLLPAPLLVLLWSAGTAPLGGLALALAAATALAVSLPFLAARLARLMPRSTRVVADLAPLLVAALVWRTQPAWMAVFYP